MNGFKDQVEFAEQRSGDVVLRSDIDQQNLQVSSELYPIHRTG
jgi:hypothetical protein